MINFKLKLFLISGFMLFSVSAFAGSADDVASSIPGCDTGIKNIIRNYAEAKVAYEVAVIDEMIDKPRSVLKMICFKDALKKSAESSSQIFSGSFWNNIEEYIDSSLDAHLANYEDDGLTGVADSSGKCGDIGTLVSEEDADLIKPVPSFEDALADDFGSTGDKFKDSWDAAKSGNVFSNYDDAWERLDSSYEGSTMVFDETDTPCKVLEKSGLVGVDCSED